MHSTSLEDLRRTIAVPASPGLPDFVYDVLSKSSAILDGHFALQSGVHAEKFLRFRNIGLDRPLVDQVAKRMKSILDFDTSGCIVLAPESAGFFLAESFARIHDLDLAIAELDSHRAPLRRLRSGEIPRDARVLLVNDVATTGGSLGTLRDLALDLGATVAGVVVFATLDGKAFHARLADWGLPGRFLVEARWPTFLPTECPRCLEGKIPPFPASELN